MSSSLLIARAYMHTVNNQEKRTRVFQYANDIHVHSAESIFSRELRCLVAFPLHCRFHLLFKLAMNLATERESNRK